MSDQGRSLINVNKIIENLQTYSMLWIVPTIACAALAVAYAGVRSNKWKAVQVVTVRDEATDTTQRSQGEFSTPEAMKAFQETLVQTVRNSQVVRNALSELGPLGGEPNPDYPSIEEVQSNISRITAGPPKGTEFGKINLVQITTEAKTPERAEKFNALLVKHLEKRLQEMRAEKARGLIQEFQQAVEIAQRDLDAATKKLETMEKEVGRDLGELRTMTEGASGNSNLRENTNQIKQELRNATSRHEEYKQLISLLTEARRTPERLTEAPTRLFELQPALKRMKEGLIDAQIKAANLLGRMTELHPEVQAARLAEAEVKRELTTELDNLIAGLQSDQHVTANQIKNLSTQLDDVDTRLNRLAGLRTPYNNLFLEVKACNDKLAEQQKRLTLARASEASAHVASLLIKKDMPEAGTSPSGPSAFMLIAGGAAGGLLLGLGLVFVTVPIGQMWGRRRTDYSGNGRRTSDTYVPPNGTNPVRRATDAEAPRNRRTTDRTRRNEDMNNGTRISDKILEAQQTATAE